MTRRPANSQHPPSTHDHPRDIHLLLNRSAKSKLARPAIEPIHTTTINRANQSRTITSASASASASSSLRPARQVMATRGRLQTGPSSESQPLPNLNPAHDLQTNDNQPKVHHDPPRSLRPSNPADHQILCPSASSNRSSSSPLPSPSPSSSSWWSWLNLPSSQPNLNQQESQPAELRPTPSQTSIHSTQTSNSTDSQIVPIDPIRPSHDQDSYLNRLNTWAYSWIAPSSSPPSSSQHIQPHPPLNQSENSSNPGVINSIPNPVLESIPINRKSWAGYFSSRRSLPIHKVQDDCGKSVESMSIEFSSPESTHFSNPFTSGPNDPSTHKASSRLTSTQSPSPSTSSNSDLNRQRNQSSSLSETVKSTHPEYQSSRQSNVTVGRSSSKNPYHPTDHSRLLKAKRLIPNSVLPTFEDTFYRPPRSFLARPSKLQKTLEFVQAYMFSVPPNSEFRQSTTQDQGDSHPNDPHSIRKLKQVADILHRNRHISTRLPKSLDLVGINRIERLKKINKVAIVGIHGWFPGPWLESVLGKPTGTSMKFASMMDKSVRRYMAKELGVDSDELNEELTTLIVLEADGKVDDRVDRLFKELNKRDDWVQSIKSADAIFVVSHSQGCVVSCKLIERLIQSFNLFGHRILSLAMCGIWNGPYIGLNSNYALQPVLKFFEGPAAHELFEFQDPCSLASKALLKSLKNCLRLGVKYLMIGSMNDQVVPLYSSMNHIIDHPSILRAIFVDSSIIYYSKDFLTNLVVFCLKLRNAGLTDHGLIYSLSDYLIGSLTGVGHSTLYEDPDVFDLASRYFFETTSTLESPTYEDRKFEQGMIESGSGSEGEGNEEEEVLVVGKRRSLSADLTNIDQSFNPKDKLNPFLLTWCLKGMIDDHKVKLLFTDELKNLKQSFVNWNPTFSTSSSLSTSNSKNKSSSPSSPSPSSPLPLPVSDWNSKILKELKTKMEPLNLVQLDYKKQIDQL